MAKSYVKFEVSKEVSDKSLEALRLATQNGVIRKGINEVTKSVERGLATFVVIAEDVEPEEVVVHLPTICEQKKVPFVYVPTKEAIGKAVGINVPCAAVAVEKNGSAEAAIKDVVSRVTGKAPSQAQEKPAQHNEQKQHHEAAKQQKKENKKE
jgi:large subunit ribosomal protein L7Ae